MLGFGSHNHCCESSVLWLELHRQRWLPAKDRHKEPSASTEPLGTLINYCEDVYQSKIIIATSTYECLISDNLVTAETALMMVLV